MKMKLNRQNTVILFVCPPKFCISIVFVFSWDHCKSQGKLETTLMQNFGGKTKRIMVFSAVAYYGIHHVRATSVLKIENKEFQHRRRVRVQLALVVVLVVKKIRISIHQHGIIKQFRVSQSRINLLSPLMATCKICEFKLSLNMNEFRSKVGFPTFYWFFFFCIKLRIPKQKKIKANHQQLVYRVSVKIYLREKLPVIIEIKYFPSFVCLLHGKREPAAVLESSYNGANNSGPYRIFSTKLE